MKKFLIILILVSVIYIFAFGYSFAENDSSASSLSASFLRNENYENAFSNLLSCVGLSAGSQEILQSNENEILNIKHFNKFSYGDILYGNDFYISNDISIHIYKYKYKKSNCFVADIFVKDIKLLKTGFSSLSYRGKRQKPTVIAEGYNAALAITGDLYTMNADGIIVRNGIVYEEQKGLTSKKDVCVLFEDGSLRVYKKGETDFEGICDEGNVWQLWVFGPQLLEDGESKNSFNCNPEILQKNPRAAIGYFEPGHYCFVAVDGRSKDSRGLPMEDLSSFMQYIGCVEAYNLDGGASAAMVFNKKLFSNPSNNNGRTMTDIIYLNEEKDDVISD